MAGAALAKWINLVNNYWQSETIGLGVVRLHSKIILVDPFGTHPIVMAGSHNLGPRAAKTTIIS